jgi:hypothetical protein
MIVNGLSSIVKSKLPNPFLTRTLETAVKTFPKDVTIVEVGPRDGLQNEKVN